MGLMNFLFGKKGEMEQHSTMSGGQQDLLSQLLGGLSGGATGGGAMGSGMEFLQNLLGGDTSQFKAPLMRQFNEEIVPGLSERFTGMGEGAQRSGAFAQSLGKAGAGLSENLGAMRGQLQMQGLGQLGQMMGQGLGTRSFENVYRPETTGFIGGMAPGIGAALGTAATGGFGGAGGLAAGVSGAGGLLSKLMNMLNQKKQTPGPYGSYTQGQYNPYTDMTG